jgi:hypothetical protein
MRPEGRFVVTLVRQAWQQTSTVTRRFEAHGRTSHVGAQLSRRLFSTQVPGAGHGTSEQKKAIARTFPFWEKSNTYRAIIVGVAARYMSYLISSPTGFYPVRIALSSNISDAEELRDPVSLYLSICCCYHCFGEV